MKAWKQPFRATLVALMLGLCWHPLWAQEQNEEKPKPAARVLLPLPDLNGNEQQDNENNETTEQPDRGPVTGVQSPTLGTSQLRHSYWVPGLTYSNTSQSRPANLSASPGWAETSYVTGSLSLLEARGHTLLSMDYSGGGFFSNDPLQSNGQFQQLASALEIDGRRWQALFIDQFSYLPVSTFGFGGTGNLSFPGITGALAVPLPGLQSVFLPGQSVLSVVGPRYSNASAGQLTYQFSRRASITFSGVHGLLRFINPGSLNSDTEIANVGFNYAVSRKDYLGLTYRFNAFHYPGDPQALGDHVAQLLYGRRVTGRLGLNVSGGAEATVFRIAVNGSSQRVSFTGMASLVYGLRRGSLNLSYIHGISNGSGLFTGANTDLANASLYRPLSQVWTGSVSFGYSKNKQIVGVAGLNSPTYDSWIPGAGLSRPLGRTANLYLGYQAQIQSSNLLFCTSPNCGTSYTTHQIQLSFQWHAAPQVLR